MTYNDQRAPEILVYDRDTLEPLGRIRQYTDFRFTRNLYECDNFEFVCHADAVGAEYLTTAALLGYYDGTTTRLGQIEKIETTLEPQSNIIRCTGRSGAIFKNRILLEGTTTGTGYDTVNGVSCETAIKHYVDANVVNSSESRRNVASIEIAADQQRGAAVTYSARFEVLADLLSTLGQYAGIGWELTFDRNARKFIFDVISGADKSADVKFSTGFKNVLKIDYLENLLNVPNVAIVGGQGEAQDREIVTVDTAPAAGLAYKETFVDARDITGTTELTLRGAAELDAYGDGITLEVNVSNNTFTYIADWNLGDIVTVTYPQKFIISARIISISEIVDMNGRRLEVTVGTSGNDLIRMVQINSRKSMGARR